MTGSQMPPRWLLWVSRGALRWRVNGRGSGERIEEYLGDLAELWAQRRAAGQHLLPLRTMGDVIGLLRHSGARTARLTPYRARHVLVGVNTMWHDVCYSFRLMRRQPLFSALTLTTLTLGIAASTGIFTTVDRLLLRPLAFPRPHQLVMVADPPYSFGGNRMNPARGLTDLRVFSGVGLYAQGGVNVDGLSAPVRAVAAVASPGFFTALAVPAAIGRPYTFEEDVADANRLVVISHGFWQRYLGGDSNVLDRDLSINRRLFRITAVMPEGFSFPGRTDLWLPSGADRQTTGQGFAPRVVARLAPGVSHAEAEAALAAFDRERGAPERETTAPRVTGLQEALTGDAHPTLWLLAISVGLVLMVTTANVAGLLLARMTRRQPELVVRRALGATRWRLFQLMALDAASYAAVAGVAGAALSVLILRAISVYSGGLGGLASGSSIDGRMLLIAIGVSALSALLFGLAPSLAVWTQPAAQAVRGGVAATPGRAWRWARHGLVVGQVACALVLLTVTTSTIGTMRRLAAVDLAFDGRGVLGLDVTLPTTAYEGPEPASLFIDDAVARLRSLPGVASAGATGALPGDPSTGIGVQIGIQGETRAAGAPPRFASFLSATPGYFESMGVPIVQGRAFTDADRRGAPRVAMISESAARLLWPDGRSPVGLQIESGFRAMTPYEVVGVVPDILLDGPEAMARSVHLYLPIAQHPPFGNVSFAIKTAGDPLALAPGVRAAIAGVDSSLPVYNLRSMADVSARFLAAHRMAVAVMGAFAMLTLLLAGVGLYGVLAQLIEQQTREIGIRVALGADPRRVRRGVVSFAVRLATVGVIAGAAGSSLAATLVASYVPRLDAIAWPIVATHAGVMLIVALVAAWVPARRASAVDPIVALRE